MISKLHYIIPDSLEYHKKDWYQKVCDSGIDWIQLRWKTIDDDEFVRRVNEVKNWLEGKEVKLIVNDRIHLMDQFEVDGFHLGKTDMELCEGRARARGLILGATTNSLEDILERKEIGVDYFGLGPFRFTNTKKNLSPVLGLDGYRAICRSSRLALEDLGLNTPIVAIGGIQNEDIEGLLEAGVHGVAISSYFNENTEKRIKEMLQKLEGNYAFG
ncbi:MAG: thiamine phosphate synthase [Crocinitomicaceae bacterium]|nr:thiamine phosphate synthase [Crocinitomicaceae bacterium]